MNSPAIRFAGFTEDWEGRSIDECFTERNERSEFGDLISVTMNFGVIKAEHLRRHDTSSDDKSNYKKVEVGDIAYNSMRMWQGASGHSQYSGILSPAYTVITPQEGTHSPFFAYLFKRPSMIQLFQINSQGLTSDTWNLKWPKLRSISVIVPEFKEQQHLSELFATIDSFITLHQREHDKSVNIKKALLEKMFPKDGEDKPEIRFAGFTGAWEQRELGDVATVSSGYMGDSLLNDGKYKLTRIETISDGFVDLSKVGFTNSQPNASYRLNKGDILYSNINSLSHIGKVAIYHGNLPLYHGINLLRVAVHESQNPAFLFYQLNTGSKKKWANAHANKAVSQASINQSLLAQQQIQLCEIEEQSRIGVFFSNIDRLIALHQRELTKLQNIKKALLEKMFV